MAGGCVPQEIWELRHAEHRVHGVYQRQACGCGAEPCAARACACACAICACSAGVGGTAASRSCCSCGTVLSHMRVCGVQML